MYVNVKIENPEVEKFNFFVGLFLDVYGKSDKMQHYANTFLVTIDNTACSNIRQVFELSGF